MFNKTMIALAATAALSSISATFAYEDPENKIGDRYPFLEQRYSLDQRQSAASARMIAAGSGNSAMWQSAYVGQYASEVPENKIGDRYPLLEQAVAPTARDRTAGQYLATRQSRRVSTIYLNEAPENKIGDRYPLLEPRAVQRATTGVSTASKKPAAKHKV